ncbi:WhiB family transcriptional regulator [Streptomyces sp. NPDC021096]|uniref:WhiB family transcriptional regulator n=1 Tax=Streptomyces sp. NPDC021096 TaxID=3154792 RepID=UPI003402F2DF
MPASALRAPVSAYPHPTDARRSADWRTRAACIGLPEEAVFARRPKAALPALRACAVCTVSRSCLETVAPRESWDGVCAGRLWRNGREARLPEAPADPQKAPDTLLEQP